MSISDEQADAIRDVVAILQIFKRDGVPTTEHDITTQAREDLEALVDDASKDQLALMIGVLLAMAAPRYEEDELTELAMNALGLRS